ncbi:thermonuclease family protein [Roseomonas populi]|uniref:Thermonuclease family protein n=1 Tax=Roseomonas populi TaxID=3121582 RepID=A0ABT1WXP0_9PROT|nr:thermonuclease family protein [Roseomonas pecuniae]MCR0980602.1 thermonuclease family protein [Roseomonas pecuniae]
MLPRRRIFRPAPSPRAWRGPLLLLGLAAGAATLVGLGGPTQLFGNSPREQEWAAAPADVRVVDGDTLRLSDRIVRLRGLEAPARGQACRDAAGREFDCGAGSAEALSRLLGGRGVSCRVRGRDRFGRGLGQCSTLGGTDAAGVELNGALVSAGWALAEDEGLAGMEGAARASGRGLWATGVRPPEGWSASR